MVRTTHGCLSVKKTLKNNIHYLNSLLKRQSISSLGQTPPCQFLMLVRFKTLVVVVSSSQSLLIWAKILSTLLPWMVLRVLSVEQKWLIPAPPSWFQLALLCLDASWMSLENPLMSVALSRWGFGNWYQGRWSPHPLCLWWKDWSVWRCWCRGDCWFRNSSATLPRPMVVSLFRAVCLYNSFSLISTSLFHHYF